MRSQNPSAELRRAESESIGPPRGGNGDGENQSLISTCHGRPLADPPLTLYNAGGGRQFRGALRRRHGDFYPSTMAVTISTSLHGDDIQHGRISEAETPGCLKTVLVDTGGNGGGPSHG
ncbi:Hypothetical protein NTJ_07537 [Nesidiocoris tenuis]|uniref:Uncharacterized protein n=1 Tax=Nesidiocoris tenuis TaxID=355587 RepID=A0ABN7ARP2_9HEMI|nr:Hypothetical protein NTJ_07537 [Nesidiocoris tenuis]